jgi:1-acyl-sn-glycerol-3-phosphate acyltransferase
MLRFILVAGFFFSTLPLMIALQWVLGATGSTYWGPASVGYYRLLARLLRIRIIINGKQVAGRPVLIVSNHVSWVDIVVLAAIAPMVFVAKREVASWPLIGAAARVQKAVFVDRGRRQQTADSIKAIARRLADGHAVVLFAEGTSGDGNRVLGFRSALVGAADEAASREAKLGDVLLQPMAICYTAQNGLPMTRNDQPLVAWYGDLDFFPHFAGFIRRGAVDVTVSFGTPVTAASGANRKTLTQELEATVRAMMAAALHPRSSRPPTAPRLAAAPANRDITAQSEPWQSATKAVAAAKLPE